MWDDLIIIAYKGGSGGDFLTNEINKAIDPSYTYDMTTYNKSNFSNPLGLFSTPCLVLYYIECLLSNDPNGGFNQFFEKEEKIAVDWIYDRTPAKILDNLKREMTESVEHLQNKKIAINIKYFNRPGKIFEQFTIDWVFPKSKKFVLGYEHKNKYLLMAAQFFKTPWIPPNPELYLNKQFENNYINDYTEFEDFTQIFADKLYFGDFNYLLEVEDLISSKVGYRISLDKEAFKVYRANNDKAYRYFLGDDYLNIQFNKDVFMNMFDKMKQCGYENSKYKI